eukprot:12928560-Prorocentrum_lima.AAC.1
MALDAKNAFGTMSRHSLAEIIQAEFPELRGLVPNLLGSTHKAYWMDGAGQRRPISMATGVHQG